MTANGYRASLKSNVNVLKLNYGNGCSTSEYSKRKKNTLNCTFKWVNVMVCESYPKNADKIIQ